MNPSRTVAFGTVIGVDDHDTGAGHPERPVRLQAVSEGVAAAGLGDALMPLETRTPTRDELTRVHTPEYLDALQRFVTEGGGHLDPDTRVGVGSWSTAVASAGLGLAAIDALQRGDAAAAFVAPRPPGHHATATRAMGFCLLNNVAIAAAALAAQGQRVLILDWDVHHGNGTQDLFWDDPRVLYASLHESPAYPGTGGAAETGGPSAAGLTFNVPLPSGTTGDVALQACDELLDAAADVFRPDWVLISAGFDAHRDDPLADLAWSAGDYAELTNRVMSWAPVSGRVIAFLEGGYDLRALAHCAGATVAALTGASYRPEPPTQGGPGAAALERIKRVRASQLEGNTPQIAE